MKLSKIWKKIGVQPLRITQHTDAIVFDGNEKYYITGMKYENGRMLGFEAEKIECSTCANHPKYHNGHMQPHTCDICSSLDEDDYCMWALRKEK